MIDVFFQYDFLMYSLYTSLMIGFLAPFLGVFIVVRRLSLMADALSHITLTGIAFSLLLGRHYPLFAALNPVYMGIAFSVTGSIFIERLRNVYKFYKELAIPIILSTGIGIGVVFISLANGFNNDLFNYLFGSVIAINKQDFYVVIIVTIIVTALLILFYKEWFFLSFDEEQAVISGIPRRTLHFLFMIMVALVIGISMQIVGILLVSALMTLPVAAAMRWARGFKQMFFYAILFGEISVLTGLISAFHLDLAPGGTIVMVNVLILLVSITLTKKR
ncbi:metal ABC transporter permease [Salipaludibacillus neizhouensis]|uniref:Metal ABC transporter permease n=1 Tax=Salipaludibacillus neizhouensis TaxID=885475 RepID=A0A3A9KDS1_9BACI|nr:metal ABC transporter permease [Salipaludibacillus neizhouensis]RKL68702.1 metal ABC transporter permease [Salipaludibacillus neizhouensis]